jgi:hypothetical protein
MEGWCLFVCDREIVPPTRKEKKRKKGKEQEKRREKPSHARGQ